MAKLSKTMIEVLKKAYNDIDKAKKLDYPQWLLEHSGVFDFRPEHFARWTDREAAEKAMAFNKKNYERALAENHLKEYWEMDRNNIVLTHCSSETLRALENRGYIRIIRDSAGERYGIDRVEILIFDVLD